MKLCVGMMMLGGCLGLATYNPGLMPDATLDAHVKYMGNATFKTVPRDLSATGDIAERTTHVSKAPKSDEGINDLSFMGIVDGELCFAEKILLPTGDARSTAEFQKDIQDHWAKAGASMWMEAVPSLDALAHRPAFPVPPTGVALTDIKVMSDDAVEVNERLTTDSGDTTTVKVPKRKLVAGYCAKPPSFPATAKYVVVVEHFGPSDNDEKARADNYNTDDERTAVRMQHDGLFVYQLTP